MKRGRVRRVARRRSGLTVLERRRLHTLFRTAVMLRSGAGLFTDQGRDQWFGVCEWCRQRRWLQAAHIEPVGRFPALRFEPENAVALCTGCHIFKWHKSPREAERWITEYLDYRYGPGTRARLALRAQTAAKPDWAVVRIRLEVMVASSLKGGVVR